jgi:hypothetical protein
VSVQWEPSVSLFHGEANSVREQHLHALEIEGQTHQTPFTRGSDQAAQGELAKAQIVARSSLRELNHPVA